MAYFMIKALLLVSDAFVSSVQETGRWYIGDAVMSEKCCNFIMLTILSANIYVLADKYLNNYPKLDRDYVAESWRPIRILATAIYVARMRIPTAATILLTIVFHFINKDGVVFLFTEFPNH